MTQERKNEMYEKMLAWVLAHVKNDKELFRILYEELGMTQEEFHDNGIDSLDYLFEAQKIDDTVGKIAVIHLHRRDDDYHFINAHDNTFFRVSRLCQRFYEEEDRDLTIDTIAHSFFGAEEFIDSLPFSILVDACKTDARVNVIVEIDMDEDIMNVLDKSGEWKTHHLQDIFHALKVVERNSGDGINRFCERMFRELMEWNHVNVVRQKAPDAIQEGTGEQIPVM